MEIVKELSSIALPILEPEYRNMPELSYSTLSTYEREGFNNLGHLFDRKESPSLTFGSCVDAWITGGRDEFDRLFYVAEFPSMGDKELLIVKDLFSNYSDTCAGFSAIPYEAILTDANVFEFQRNWRDDTRVKVLIERCSVYYNLMYLAGDKTIIDGNTYNDVVSTVNALRNSPATSGYFMDDDEDTPVRRYYQLKFRADLEGVGYRCMMDLAIVDYDDKVIIPCDLKTSSHKEWDFQESFCQWNYMIQGRLYWSILRANLDADPYFKDFELKDYRFIVVNRSSLVPLVWEFPLTKVRGTLVDDVGKLYRDPLVIGRELRQYLDSNPQVPMGIDVVGTNTITKLKALED